MTRQLMRDEHMQYVTGLIRNQVEAGNYYGVGGRRYNYKDPANPVSLFEDQWNYWTAATHLGGKSPVDGFLGSYGVAWAAVPTSRSTARVFFTVTNLTDSNSGLYHINSLIHHTLDLWSTGPLSGVYQTYQWQVTIGY
jgi:hypothetical protein